MDDPVRARDLLPILIAKDGSESPPSESWDGPVIMASFRARRWIDSAGCSPRHFLDSVMAALGAISILSAPSARVERGGRIDARRSQPGRKPLGSWRFTARSPCRRAAVQMWVMPGAKTATSSSHLGDLSPSSNGSKFPPYRPRPFTVENGVATAVLMPPPCSEPRRSELVEGCDGRFTHRYAIYPRRGRCCSTDWVSPEGGRRGRPPHA